jgi:BON domain
MNEPLFVSSPPVWSGSTPWAGSWYPPAAGAGPLPIPQTIAASSGGIASQVMATSSAPMLIAAVAMNRGQPQGPTNDHEVEELIYDTLELFSGANDVEVRCEAGRVTLSGTVSHKRLKRDIGEIAWAIPSLNDVQNNITLAQRRRTRSLSREGEPQPAASAGRKQA